MAISLPLISAMMLTCNGLKKFYSDPDWEANGSANYSLDSCPDCVIDAYINEPTYQGYAWCEFELGECQRCEEGLTPENVAWNDSQYCDYCDHMISKTRDE
jgi:hypothetical protein